MEASATLPSAVPAPEVAAQPSPATIEPVALLESPAAMRARRRAAVLRGVARVLGSAITLGMFGGALVAGYFFYGNQNQPLVLGPYPAVATVPEPPAAHHIVELILADDAPALSKELEADALEALSGALRTIEGNPQPLVSVTSIKYLGAVQGADQTVVSYLANGRDAGGTKWVVGFALRVQEDQVVGVN